jgi:fumarate hydratase class I
VNTGLSPIGSDYPFVKLQGRVSGWLPIWSRHVLRFEGFAGSIEDAINEGVRRGYNHPDNVLRASIVADPQFERKNTKDNTPAVVHMTVVPGNTVDVQVAAKGGGSENKSKFVMMNPSDNLVDWAGLSMN